MKKSRGKSRDDKAISQLGRAEPGPALLLTSIIHHPAPHEAKTHHRPLGAPGGQHRQKIQRISRRIFLDFREENQTKPIIFSRRLAKALQKEPPTCNDLGVLCGCRGQNLRVTDTYRFPEAASFMPEN